jgi:NADH:ubiquinone oxidoreductase subunit K
MLIHSANNIDLILQDPFCSPWTWLPYNNLLTLGFLISAIGLYGIVFNFKNFLVTMMCIELAYLGVSLTFIINSLYFFDPIGQLYSLLLIILAAGEAAVGLGLLIVIFRIERRIDFATYRALRG